MSALPTLPCSDSKHNGLAVDGKASTQEVEHLEAAGKTDGDATGPVLKSQYDADGGIKTVLRFKKARTISPPITRGVLHSG
jgi:hypothetical protein